MRKRLYFLLPDLPCAQQTMNDLLLARIEERHLHFLARDGMDISSLHEASLMQRSDLVHGAEAGLLLGGATGIVLGLLIAMYPPAGPAPQWGLTLLVFLVGGVFGAWAASMIGSSLPNSRLKQFSASIAEGKILMMVDVPRWRVAAIEMLLGKDHPEAVARGVEPSIPAFP